MKDSLKRKTVVGTLWSSFQKFGKMGISFIANLIMARLLTPEDYGTIGMLMVFISLSIVFIDSGFGNALIQKSNPTVDDYSTIFYFNLMVSVFLYLILFFSAPAIARFYNMEILCKLLRILSTVLIINALSLIQDCRLRKEMSFKLLSIRTVVSALLGAGAGIYCAINGLGVWSLVIYNLVEALSRTIMLWLIGRWVPKLVFSWKSLKELFSFGGFLLANSLLFTLRRTSIPLFIGKLYSASDLGYYSQAKKLEDIPVSSLQHVIGQVTFPLFSTLKNSSEQMKTAQRKGNLLLAFLCIPLMTLFIVLAKDLIVLLYTEKWVASIPYFQVLCICGIFVSLQETNANVINALGYSRLYFIWSIVKTVVLFVFLFIGSYFGIYGMLMAWCLQNIIAYVINAVLSGKYTKYGLGMQMKDLLPIFCISIISGVLIWLFGQYIKMNILLNIITQTLLFVLLYLCGFHLFKSDYLADFFSTIKVIKK